MIEWYEDEKIPLDRWELDLDKLECTPFVEDECNNKRKDYTHKKKAYTYNGVPANPIAHRIREVIRERGLSIKQMCLQINALTGKNLGRATMYDLLSEKYAVVAHTTAQAIETWLQQEEMI